jgi:hypothetical protein
VKLPSLPLFGLPASVLALAGCGSGGTSEQPQASGGSETASGGSAAQSGFGGSAGAGESSSGTAGSGTAGSAGAGSGTAGSAGAGSGTAGSAGAGPRGASQKCPTPVSTTLPDSAPALEVGVWKNITPASHLDYLGSPETMIAQGIAMDPCNVATLYWGTTPYQPDKGGLFKTKDGGGSWTKIGPFDEPLHVRVNPTNPQHMYVGDGVRGSTQGFWVSHDGGETWAKPAGFQAVAASIGITQSSGMDDIYDVAVDPTDFDHVLLSFHSPWSWDEFDLGAGIIESKDGGNTWNVIERQGFGHGHSIKFLYEPEQGIGDSNTWLLGTQGPGYWRTSDAGKTWTQVSTNGIAHGGGTSYYTKDGVLYASGNPQNLRSTDNGETWTELSVGGATCIFGDGQQLYSAPAWGMNPFFVSPESDGLTWEPQAGDQVFVNGGPYEMVMDKANGIIYASMWEQGVWAMKVAP